MFKELCGWTFPGPFGGMVQTVAGVICTKLIGIILRYCIVFTAFLKVVIAVLCSLLLSI